MVLTTRQLGVIMTATIEYRGATYEIIDSCDSGDLVHDPVTKEWGVRYADSGDILLFNSPIDANAEFADLCGD